jgi:hypothetical protein
VMKTALKYAMAKRGISHFNIFNPNGKRLSINTTSTQ